MMEGRLNGENMDQLEQWIGKGPKTFNLLYAITRDGCNAKIFHQKCDNQGPTVTVLYNHFGSVYGGFTSVSWLSQTSTYVGDNKAFLFQLLYNGNKCQNKFRVIDPQYAVMHDKGLGPCFGCSDYDLATFKGVINYAWNGFRLNGFIDIGSAFHHNGMTAQQINNNTMFVTELEVYKVADGQRRKAWRKHKDWNGKFLDKLKEEITTYTPVSGANVSEARILMIGPIGAGKSSFFNTIDSSFRGRITQRAACGSAEQSVSIAYEPYKVGVKSGAPLKFRLCDTRGLEESMGINLLEFNYLLEGNIPDHYEFSPTSAITTKSPGFKSDPSTNDLVHCAVFVLDSTAVEAMSTKIIEKIKEFRGHLFNKRIPQVILLTKIDKLCEEVHKDISCVFHSPVIKQAVANASQLFGLPEAHVLLVKNYENEMELDQNVDILALMSLRKMLDFTEDFMINLIDKKNDLQADMEKLNIKN